ERFRGELLEGLSLPDCYRYQEWCTAERESARALRIAVLCALERTLDDPEEALRAARERVALDPLSEAAHAAVVRILADLGRKREALAQYETCSRILGEELGVRPSAVLLEARMRLGSGEARSGSSGPPATKVTEAAPVSREPDSSLPPFVGRSAELSELERVLGGAALGQGPSVLVILGEPGMGKTRLLDELRARVTAAHGMVLSGRAFEAEAIRPYGPWIDALRPIAQARVPEPLRATLAPLLPELGGWGAPAADRLTLFDGVARLLLHLSSAEKGPIALVLDDAHWFDEASAALLHYVARALAGARVLFAFGARPGELSDNSAALKLVRGLGRERLSVSLELAPLDAQATSALARAFAPSVDAQRIVRESAGNPLLTLELARALSRGDDAAWDSIGSLISERLGHLDESARELLVWAAALGKNFDLETLAGVTGLPPLDLFGRLGELERHGIIKSTAGGEGYDFVHDLVRVGAYRQLTEPRRRVMHRNIARALETLRPGDPSLASEVAHHAALGGDAERAVRSALTAAKRSLSMFAEAEAARLADLGLKYVAELPRELRIAMKIELLGVHVFSPARIQRQQFVKAELTRAVMEAQDAGLSREAAAGLHVMSVLQFDVGDLAGARETTLRALTAVSGSDAVSRARQLGCTARCLAMLECDMERARAMHDEALALAEGEGVDLPEVDASGGMLHAFDGEFADAARLLERALSLSRKAGDRWQEYEYLRYLLRLELDADRHEHALRRSAELLEVAAKMGEGSELPAAMALAALGRLCVRDPAAGDAVERSIVALREVDAKGMLAYVLTFSAERDVEASRFDSAQERAREALAAAEQMSRKSQAALARVVLARVALARGDAQEAERELAAVGADFDRPRTLSSRARAAVLGLRDSLSALPTARA
ncbi:MAG TPA: AAA family ATPase, partial [Polyangiaceae bacterium]|nr:AAA family ATPase [Polyangiaceae bacterium]